ncbi:non-canonical purine NTP pyrophosphatase (RdgB/HAM1 family) [Archangium gephyra]|uniref:Non-canonical purine NTP pyrophosphatase (RdgB/HAM1 family) n=1 Tax=Archangium gephyra TaxID=48 RepID=A0ABX9JSN0_9BACT|nr:non-canonical purine NTP pyrophosphatase [Archangium gephyra]REG26179.1 non-canonical purine NTP pyrophosphatase (RdgB/HAM1 family) [Archangium gephyra]
MKKITFVSTNRGKAKVLEKCLAAVGYELERLELPIIEPQGSTLEAVALDKARQAFAYFEEPLVVEDSGLCVDSLAGFPGPVTKYMLETIGVAGLLRLAHGQEPRTCRFVGAMVYVDEDGTPHTFVDRQAVGSLALEADSTRAPDAWSSVWNVFIPEGGTSPLSALSPSERDAVFGRWQHQSVYAQFARWLVERDGASMGRRGGGVP